MKFTSLTPRERDVLRLVPTGMRNKQIAKKLGITEGTVKLHRGRGMLKLGVVNATELVGLVRDGLDVEDPIRSSLKNACRLLLALSNLDMRGQFTSGQLSGRLQKRSRRTSERRPKWMFEESWQIKTHSRGQSCF